ncbi:MAG TPA: hypothetical protein VHO28_08270 [Ignavibacteriales bacterium]|nr:hypothetical protein [Ignavibacteriales bacterium]
MQINYGPIMLNLNSLLSFLIAILSFLLASCYEETNLVQSNALEKKFYKKLATKIDSNIVYVDSIRFEMEYAFGDPRNFAAEEDMIIEPQAQLCGTKTTYGWGVDHFEPMAGKLVGIWPEDGYHSSEHLLLYKNKWGYLGLVLGADSYEYNEALQAGYLSGNLMLNISYPAEWSIDNFNAGRYNAGEAIDHACNGNAGKTLYSDIQLTQMMNYVHTRRPNSVFVIDSYKRCQHMLSAYELTDRIMCSAYNHWYEIPGFCNPNMSWGPSAEWYNFVEGGIDQRSDWSDMRNYFGIKFSSTWINTYELSEFGDLFGYASNLGLSEIWIYARDVHQTDQFENISLAAWNSRFLRRFDRKYRIEWRCDNPDPCQNCDPTNGEDGWYVISSTPTYEVKEVIR